MDRIPFGIARLDSMIGGGAPAGSVVLLAGDLGAGAREFCYTSAAMNALSRIDESRFDLYYGDLGAAATPPAGVHYLSFTDEPAAVRSEMEHVMEPDLLAETVDAIEFVDFSREYFKRTPVPTEWYAEATPDITALAETGERRDVLEVFAEYLTANAKGNLVIVDSVTDLVSLSDDPSGTRDLSLLVNGLSRATHDWGGLVLLLANRESLHPRTLGRLKSSADGTLSFEWESGGSDRARTLVVEEFRGVLSRLEDEDIVRFETEITDAGFDVSNVRKIR